MGNRTNHGSVGLRNGQPQINGAALSQMNQQLMVQQAAEQRQQAFTEQMIMDTGKQIFALMACQLDIPPVGQLVDEVSLRHLANVAVESAKYYVERLGLVKIEAAKTDGSAADASAATSETDAPKIEQDSPAEPGSRIILP